MNHTMNRTEKFLVSLLFVVLSGWFAAPAVVAQQAKNYQEAMAKGNLLLKQKKYLDAKAYFQMALRFRVHDPAATEKINETVKRLKAGESIEEAYYNIIDKADDYYDKNMLNLAVKAYQKALNIIPGDSYAAGRIKEIRRQQTVEKQKLIQYKKHIKSGDSLLALNLFNASIASFEKAQDIFPGKTLAQDKIVLARQMQHNYQNRLQKAQKEVDLAGRYLLTRDYIHALLHYQAADSLVPGNPEVQKRIRQLKPKAATQKAYNRVAAEADRLYVARNYMAALEKYRQAQKLWPENSYPAEMIAKVNGQLAEQRKNLEHNYRAAVAQADSLFRLQQMQNARAQYNLALSLKPGAPYPRQQLQKIKSWFIRQQQMLQANYKAVIRRADSLFAKGAYEAARDRYLQAEKTRPDDPYPPSRLKEIDSKLAAIARQKEKEAQYQNLVAEANRLQAAGHFDLAIEKYRQAQTLKNSDTFCQAQIDKINARLAEMQKQKERDENYARQIILGQRLLQQKQLEEAKKAYVNAQSIKPEETLPKQKISIIDSLIREKARAAQIEKEYRAAIQQGKNLYGQKKYEEALAGFKKAHQLKPGDTYSGKMIQSIQTTLAAIARAKALQQAYEESNAKAGQLLKEQKYELAKAQYQNSLTIKPDESYPKKQIADINATLARLAKEREQRYAAALSKADNLFNSRNYFKAVKQYEVAASIKPGEPYPHQQVTACKTYIAQIVAEQTAKYNQAVAEADKLYKNKIFDKAIRAYKKAQKAKPDETYPARMIKQITDYIQKNAIVDLIREKTVLPAGQTKTLTFKALPINIRKNNYVYIKARNLTGKPFRIIVTYGKGKMKNGGFYVQVPPGKKEQDFIIRIGAQYKWFSDDNDWIGLYPENNPVEISLVRISKSD